MGMVNLIAHSLVCDCNSVRDEGQGSMCKSDGRRQGEKGSEKEREKEREEGRGKDKKTRKKTRKKEREKEKGKEVAGPSGLHDTECPVVFPA
ncbi:hypothetical protein IF1G_09441 [Cordyceps javanica]|uniref:Uncharacterized protein n=1 Tax=Cordyceps javanica TaxID=43265 RepID=A0A545UQW4_9HYPO|nr:hypothetical protein IF1G_09441 [Cordyceps javanica]